MSTADPNHVISINITKFPQNLLLPGIDNSVTFQVSNQSSKEEHFKFVFEGENLEIDVNPSEFSEEVLFKAGESKTIQLQLNPTADGFGKLTVNAYWMKLVEYIVNVEKIRDTIPLSKISRILKDKKYLKPVKSDNFNPKDFIITTNNREVKNIEKQIKESAELQANNQSKSNADSSIKLLAKSYLSLGEFYKALETSLQLTNEAEKLELYYNLIRANATLNLENTLQAIQNLNDKERRNNILQKISFNFLNIDPEQIDKILSVIENDSVRENILLEVISLALEKNYTLALKFADLIKDEVTKIKVLFNIVKNLNDNKKDELIVPIIKQINQTILNSNKINLSDQNEYLNDSICIIAELENPEEADKVIKGLSSEELKQKIKKDLYNEIYKMVQEKQTKVEPIGEFSQFFLLNTYASQINKEVTDFSLIGGNASSNILMGNFNFTIALISLFSFNFSIFPIIDRVYSEINYNSKKSISYYIFPSISEHNPEELKIIQTTLKRFFRPESIRNRVIVFNLDFIPYLGKPSVILSSMTEDVNFIKSKIVKAFGDKVDVIIDEDLFQGGKSFESLGSVFSGNNFNIVNMVLSYEFINDYNIFKSFVQSLI